MKHFLLFLFIVSCLNPVTAQSWVKADLTLSAGGTLPARVYNLEYKDAKLYAATSNGMYVSPSGNGGDWVTYGLQGKKVYLTNFDILQLALTIETAADDATKKTLQLYKHNGTEWQATGFNPGKLKIVGDYPENLSNFTQLQNGADVCIALPTWGNGIWISQNGGQSWNQVPFEAHPSNGYHFYRKIPGVFSFPGDTKLYALDKADFGMQYLSSSTDFGASWSHKEVDNFFNPWALYKRTMGNASYLYYGGENGEKGYIYRSSDEGNSWEGSLTVGDGGLHNRRMLADATGKLYLMSGRGNVYVSNDNGETFTLFGTGITQPQPVANFYLTDLLLADNRLILSSDNEGIFTLNLLATGLEALPSEALQLNFNRESHTLIVSTQTGDRIQLYNMAGMLVHELLASSDKTQLSTASMAPSVYIIAAKSPDGTIKTNRISIY